MFPAVLTVTDGAWFAPRNGLLDFVEPPLASADEVGDYRVLYLGDPRLIPFPSQDLGDGVAMALVGDGPADQRDRWPVPDQPADADVRDAIEQIRTSTTLRGGRLLAPFAIRYIVVPFVDGATSTAGDPLPVPAGLLDLLGAQLDLVRAPQVPTFARFENRAAMPDDGRRHRRAGRGVGAGQHRRARRRGHLDRHTDDDRRRRHARGERPTWRRARVLRATPLDESWQLDVGGSEVAGRDGLRRRFGVRRRRGRSGELRYRQPGLAHGRARRPGVAVVARAAGGEPDHRPAAPAHPPCPRRDAHRPRRRQAAELPDRTGFSWVDELFAEEDDGVVEPADDRGGPRDRPPDPDAGDVGGGARRAAPWRPARRLSRRRPRSGRGRCRGCRRPRRREISRPAGSAPVCPAAGEEGTGGEILIANTGDVQLDVRVTLLAGPGEQVEQSVVVPPFQRVA